MGSRGARAVFFAVVVAVRVVLGGGLIVSEVASASASWSAALSRVALVAVLAGLRVAGAARARVAAVDFDDDATGILEVEVAVEVEVTFRVKVELQLEQTRRVRARAGDATGQMIELWFGACRISPPPTTADRSGSIASE